MYKDLPGAFFTGNGYAIPCDSKINVSLVFGCVTFLSRTSKLSHVPFREKEYPIHPIDVVFPTAVENDTLLCEGTFEYNPEIGTGACESLSFI
jgi:hypothetical protein